jgi:uroporphyrinogen-III decarboxylase
MEAHRLKQRYGDRLVFWGGGVDTQWTLPFGSPQEVYDQVRRRIDVFNAGGGFVFNTIHNVQQNVPIDNLMAMVRALQDARGR